MENPEIKAEKPKIKQKEYEFNLNDPETALIIAINNLTKELKLTRLANNG